MRRRLSAALWFVSSVVGSTVLGAQAPAPSQPNGHLDVAAGITMNEPKDVNQRPLCTDLGLPCQSPRTFPDFGFALQLAAHPLPHIAVVAEASTYANRWDTAAVNPVDQPRENHARAWLIGPRVTSRVFRLSKEDKVETREDKFDCRAFAQLLVGRETSTILPARTAVQPGGGVDFKLSYPGTWVRLAGDYRSTHGGPRNLSTGRVLVALVAAP